MSSSDSEENVVKATTSLEPVATVEFEWTVKNLSNYIALKERALSPVYDVGAKKFHIELWFEDSGDRKGLLCLAKDTPGTCNVKVKAEAVNFSPTDCFAPGLEGPVKLEKDYLMCVLMSYKHQANEELRVKIKLSLLDQVEESNAPEKSPGEKDAGKDQTSAA